MAELKDYLRNHKKIVAEHCKPGAGVAGQRLAWVFISVAVLVTGWQTHRLAVQGMRGSAAFAGWEDWAAALTVILLEGTAVAVTWCHLQFFRGVSQRKIGNFVSAAIWAVLAINMLVAFAMSMNGGQMNGLMRLWAQFMFPIAIVGAGVFWKEVLHRDPISEQRIAALKMAAEETEGFREIHQKIRDETLRAYRLACEEPEVKEAIRQRVIRAAQEQAAEIIGEIHALDAPVKPDLPAAPRGVNGVNGHIPIEELLPDFSPRRQ